jgi:predicted small lipoprotein YifL
MFRKLSLLLTVAAALGLVVAMSGCGKKGGLEKPPAEAAIAAPFFTA